MSFPYRQDKPMPVDTRLQKWNEIGQLVHSAILSERLRRRVRLVFEILALLNEEEEKAIGVQKWWKDKWLRGALRQVDDFENNMALYQWNLSRGLWAFSDYGVDENGKKLTEKEWLDNWNNIIFDIRQGCGKILRLVCEFCESKGVRISRGVEAEGPRGHVIGVSRIVGERVEVESRKEVDESTEESSESEAAESKTGEQS